LKSIDEEFKSLIEKIKVSEKKYRSFYDWIRRVRIGRFDIDKFIEKKC